MSDDRQPSLIDLLGETIDGTRPQPTAEEIAAAIQAETKITKVPDRKLRRIRFKNPAAIRAWSPTSSDMINQYILGHKDRSLTYMSLAFARVRLIDDRDIARVVLNKYNHRFELHLNIRRLRGYHISMMMRRADAPRFPGDTVAAPPVEVEFETPEEFDKSIKRTVDRIVLHEFGHLWFKHLKYEVRQAPPEARPFLNIITDSMVNYHLGVKLGLNKLHDSPIENPILAVTPILFPMMAVNYSKFSGLSRKDILNLGRDPRIGGEDYEHWRVIASQVFNFKPMGLSNIRDAVLELQNHAKNYTSSITEMSKSLAALFPTPPQTKDPCLGRGGGSRPGDGHSQGAGEDEFVDIHDLSPDEIPPRFDEIVGVILAGRGGDVMQRLLGEAKKISASKRVISLLQGSLERDPGRFLIQHMGKIVENRARTTWKPSKRPVLKSIALANAFATSDPPKFRTTRTIQDKIAVNKLDMYVDVSGSFEGFLTRLFPFMQDLSRVFTLTAWQFSDEIVPLTRAHLEEGLVSSTGGTDGNAILKHMRQRFEMGVRKFVVLGDRGYGSVDSELLNFPMDVQIMDLLVGHGQKDPWFDETKTLHVRGASLDSEFKIIGGKEDDETPQDRRRRTG